MAVTVVVATRNRRDAVLATLGRLSALPERPALVVVDDASEDGTAGAVRSRFPEADVLTLRERRGAASRTAGVERAPTSYVAFADDDSWYAAGALARAEEALDRDPRLALVAARVLVGPDGLEDPICGDLAAGPVLGFLACGAVVRREAYLDAGGFHPRLVFRGEERLLAVDLARRGWRLAYVPEVVAHHHPAQRGRDPARRRLEVRNDLWFAWLRLPAAAALAWTARSLREPAGLVDALHGLPWTLRERDPVGPELAAAVLAVA